MNTKLPYENLGLNACFCTQLFVSILGLNRCFFAFLINRNISLRIDVVLIQIVMNNHHLEMV